MTPTDAPKRRTRTRTRADAITIEEVARRANVSVATVSRALRGLPNVAPSTRSRVEQVARDLSYQVDTYASRLATGRSDTVGLAVPNINSWYFAQVAAGVEAVLADAGMDVLLHSVGDGAGRARLLSGQSPVRRRLDGLILIDVLLTATEIRTLAADRVHVVTVGQWTEEFPSVTVDNRAAALAATRHLLDLGHRRIGLIGGSAHTSLPFDVPGHRRQGYVEALLEASLDYHADLEANGGFSVKGGSEAMVHLMSESRPPSAVFALSDEMAMGALQAAGDLGLAVPGDVSIVGFDDHELARVFGLTTVRQDPEWHGATAGRLLLGLGDDPPPEISHVVGDTRLLVRSTTAPPRGH
ncbi:LacI family transcriptional regulator [Acidimicrobiia bacterium EGI L10123]|uniref:LacI family DNA-binding transcriptional regulator n=1 Tax=Salinilacustrithrix flava TaxID=2957203 RepID=UPI003D7C1596|nr:LacI family transcriptional regulator [Acidimicrobiia bacterium EGI L10123]